MSATADIVSALARRVADPLALAPLFDRLPDIVFFVKDAAGRYAAVNQTLVDRLRARTKAALLGRTAADVFPAPLGESYRRQDLAIARSGRPLLDRLELHVYPSGATGWCLTHKLPLAGADGRVVGVCGLSRDLAAPAGESDEYRGLAGALDRLHADFAEPITIPDLARSAGLSPYQFDRRVRKLFGLSAGQLLDKVRLDEAVRLLRETDEPVAAVALACGYGDQSAFARRFRQSTGLTPREFRNAK
ncbi:MAG TPA: AraC family transcriptional regulator [Humisphaera sp.]